VSDIEQNQTFYEFIKFVFGSFIVFLGQIRLTRFALFASLKFKTKMILREKFKMNKWVIALVAPGFTLCTEIQIVWISYTSPSSLSGLFSSIRSGRKFERSRVGTTFKIRSDT
jgi:hypothetical protein